MVLQREPRHGPASGWDCSRVELDPWGLSLLHNPVEHPSAVWCQQRGLDQGDKPHTHPTLPGREAFAAEGQLGPGDTPCADIFCNHQLFASLGFANELAAAG